MKAIYCTDPWQSVAMIQGPVVELRADLDPNRFFTALCMVVAILFAIHHDLVSPSLSTRGCSDGTSNWHEPTDVLRYGVKQSVCGFDRYYDSTAYKVDLSRASDCQAVKLTSVVLQRAQAVIQQGLQLATARLLPCSAAIRQDRSKFCMHKRDMTTWVDGSTAFRANTVAAPPSQLIHPCSTWSSRPSWHAPLSEHRSQPSLTPTYSEARQPSQ